MKKRIYLCIIFIISCFCLSFCSISKIAMNMVADALTGSGSADVFTADSDPQLVGDAIPFAIKMYEALLSQNPDHQGLINTTGSMFVMYANAFVQGPAEMLPQVMYQEKQDALERARNLYLRGFNMLYRGLELKYPGFSAAFQNNNLQQVLSRTTKADVPALYWAAAAGLSAFSLNPFDLGLGLRILEFLALVERAYELDPDFNQGALDEFLMIFHASIPAGMGSDPSRVETYFSSAINRSGGNSAGTYVAYSQAVCIPAQNFETFTQMLETALAIDIDANPSNRLVNIINQRKARFLLDTIAQYFIFYGSDNWDDWDDADW